MPGVLASISGKSKIKLTHRKFTIVVAEWNEDVTEVLYHGALGALLALGAKKSNSVRVNVPGSFELPLAAKWAAVPCFLNFLSSPDYTGGCTLDPRPRRRPWAGGGAI